MTKDTIFDSYSKDYSAVHDDHLPASVSHEQFFCQKFKWTLDQFARFSVKSCVIDFGCNHGELSNALAEVKPELIIYGIDESALALDQARIAAKELAHPPRYFQDLTTLNESTAEIAFAYNVLHHVNSAERLTVLKSLRDRLVPGGHFMVWEHNRWNPLTRYLVKICPFDEGVVLVKETEMKKLLVNAGFELLQFEYLNIAPPNLHRFKIVRWIERLFARVPLGAQYRLIAKAVC